MNRSDMFFALATLALVTPRLAHGDPGSSGSARAGAPEGLSDADWSAIRAAQAAGRHAVFTAGLRHGARNPGQRWTTTFDGRGATTRPDSGAWSWGLELVRYGFEGRERDVSGPACASAEGARLTYEWSAALSEWYVNDARGLEHGFTLRERPEGEGTLAFELAVRGSLAPAVQADGRGAIFASADGGSALMYAGLQVFDADGRALPAGVELAPEGLRLLIDERGARYPLTIDPIAQQAYLKASNTEAADDFGTTVAISGDTVVVGAPREDSGATGVDGNQADNSVFSSGAVYVFVQNGATWVQQAYLKASNTGGADRFGIAVAISGDTIVVGARQESSSATGIDGNQADDSAIDSGAAYVFVRNGAAWTQQAYVKASNTDAGDAFGTSVAIAGETLVVGANGEDSSATGVDGNQTDNSASASGAAYVFVRSGGTWSQQAYLKASNTEAGDLFGGVVAVSADRVVVGAMGEDSSATGVNGDPSSNAAASSGASYVFVRTGTTWSQEAYVKASNAGANDLFGAAVAISLDTLVVGAKYESSNATGVDGDQSNNSAFYAGAAYVFVRGGGSWSQQAYLKASNTGQTDSFGTGVAISGDTVLVGADGESSNATGVNGDQSNNSASFSGAAYLFTRSGSTWSQQAYLKASNTNASDHFGYSLAISGDTLAFGAWGEKSSATGVNGDQSDNSANRAGAAYILANVGSGTLTPFCFGDGTAAACPCGNAGAAGNGCANSDHPTGGNLAASGLASLSADSLVLAGSGMPDGIALYFQGTTRANGGLGFVFGDGLRCAGGTVVRLGTKTNAAGASRYPTAGDLSVSVRGAVTGPGTRTYQVWYHNAASYCTADTVNLTNGIEIGWVP